MNLRAKATALIGASLLSFITWKEAQAATFILDPTLRYSISDVGIARRGEIYPADGRGDNTSIRYPNMLSLVIADEITKAQVADFREFDISNVPAPINEPMRATFQIQVASVCEIDWPSCYGRVDRLGIYGVIANGTPQPSYFENGTLLDLKDTSRIDSGDNPVLNFDVTNFIKTLLENGNPLVGLGLRAQDSGSMELSAQSKLIVSIGSEEDPPIAVPEPSFILSTLTLTTFGIAFKRKRSEKN